MHEFQVVMNRKWIASFVLFALALYFCAPHAATQVTQPPAKKPTKAQTGTKKTPASGQAAKRPAGTQTKQPAGASTQPTGAQAEFEELLKLPAAERITRLQALIAT